MKIRITSFRGDHEAVLDPEIGKAIFLKMTGSSVDALSDSLKAVVPDTFKELEELWKEGKVCYLPFRKVGDDIETIKEFDPEDEELLFVSPITGG